MPAEVPASGPAPSAVRPALLRLVHDPDRATAIGIWRALTGEERRAAIAAMLQSGPPEGRDAIVERIARRFHFRRQTVEEWPDRKIAERGASLTALRSTRLADDLLALLHLAERSDLLAAYLDDLGVAHDDGRIREGARTDQDEATLRQAAEDLLEEFDPDWVTTYFLTLRAQRRLDLASGLQSWLAEKFAPSGEAEGRDTVEEAGHAGAAVALADAPPSAAAATEEPSDPEPADEFTEENERLREARVREAEHRSRLEGEADLLSIVEEDDGEALRALRQELENRAEELEELKTERTELRRRLREAGKDRELERAMAALDDARTDLEDAYEEALLASAGSFLIEDVKESHRTEHESEVLRSARESFERFTHREWTLMLDDDEGLAARDVRLGERRSLRELSSGTRMQLLLAVRMAWIRTLEETTESLPIFLDEALTTTDPARFRAVARSLDVLAQEEGRQLLYLCAQPTDVAMWEWAIERSPHVIDIAAVRFGGVSGGGPEEYALPEQEAIAPPDEGEEPEEYAARLGVPFIDPWEDPGAIHLFHLLRDDLRLLHRLASDWKVATLGQVERLLDSSAAGHAIPDGSARRRLARRCEVARLWGDAWRKGRGRPVDRGVLEGSGAITDRFIDEVNELASDLDGDPQALLDALPDVPRFWSSKIDELAEWMEEHGYLDPGEPLNRAARQARVVSEAEGLLEPDEIPEVVGWLEVGLRVDDDDSPGTGVRRGGADGG